MGMPTLHIYNLRAGMKVSIGRNEDDGRGFVVDVDASILRVGLVYGLWLVRIIVEYGVSGRHTQDVHQHMVQIHDRDIAIHYEMSRQRYYAVGVD